MSAIRNGVLVLLICALPASADAGCGLFSPCGSPGWVGFSLALPVPRLPHLHTFATRGCQSPMCGAGPFVGSGAFGGCGLFGHGCATGCGLPACGGCGVGAPTYTPPVLTPQPTFPSTTLNQCAPVISQPPLIPQQTVSYREVPQIQYRQEAYTATVPVTTYRQETRFRSVPYQTVARIPQISTHFVPQTTAALSCDPCLTAPTTAYGTTAYGTTAYGSGMTAPMPRTAAAVPEYPYPVPQPQADASGRWETIPQRQAEASTDVEQMGYYQPYSPQPRRQATRSMFRPAPSATAAWQSRFLR